MNKVPHKHAALIKEWADGAAIEWRYTTRQGSTTNWSAISKPAWELGDAFEYRIKPEPKPDVVVYGVAKLAADTSRAYVYYLGEFSSILGSNLRLTFDGETGELKGAEAI